MRENGRSYGKYTEEPPAVERYLASLAFLLLVLTSAKEGRFEHQ